MVGPESNLSRFEDSPDPKCDESEFVLGISLGSASVIWVRWILVIARRAELTELSGSPIFAQL